MLQGERGRSERRSGTGRSLLWALVTVYLTGSVCACASRESRHRATYRDPLEAATVRILKPLPVGGRDDTGLLLASTGGALLTLDRTPPDDSGFRFGQKIYKGRWSEQDGQLRVELRWEEHWGLDISDEGRTLVLSRNLAPALVICFRRIEDGRFALVRFDVEHGMDTRWGTVRSYSVPVPYLERELKRAE